MLFKNQRQKYFADYMTRVSYVYNNTLHGEKQELFAKLHEHRKTKEGPFRIVELGPGSGSNLPYYPENCSLTVVDPNPFFQPHFSAALEKCPWIKLEAFHVAYGEDMSFIEDGSVDAVVTSSVGCSLTNIQKTYKEIQRILAPGGKYYYLEHILGVPGTRAYYKQKLMAAIGVWRFINCNCHLDRDLDHQVTLAGFSSVEQRVFEMDTKPNIAFHFVSPHVTGVAIK